MAFGDALGRAGAAAVDRDRAKTAKMVKQGPPISPAYFVATMNLEDSRKFEAELRSGDRTKKQMWKDLKKTAEYKAWAKSQKKDKDIRWPRQMFDKDGNRMYKGDFTTQAVYDKEDTLPEGSKNTTHWEERTGAEMSAADRWAYANKNRMANVDQYKALGKDYKFTDDGLYMHGLPGQKTLIVNPFGEASSDYYDYTRMAIDHDVNLQDRAQASYNKFAIPGKDRPWSEVKESNYDFSILGDAGIHNQRKKGEASYASRLAEFEAAKDHPLAQDTEWAPAPELKESKTLAKQVQTLQAPSTLSAPAASKQRTTLASAPQVASVQKPRTMRKPRVNLREKQLATNQRAGIR